MGDMMRMLGVTIPFRPLSDFVLVKPIPPGETAGGIAIPDGAVVDPPKGTVVKVGPGRVTEEGVENPMPVKVGDKVYLHFAYSQPIEIAFGGEAYLITRGRDIIGVHEET
jgi:chaperonin GroES